MSTLGKSLKETLKKLSYSTSVEQLRKRGVKQVKVVGIDRIVALIEEAVHRSLRNKLMGLERSRIAGDASEEFLRLLKSNEDLERSRNQILREKQQREEEIDELRRQIEASRRELSERLAESEAEMQAKFAGENVEIFEKVNDVFRELASNPSADVGDLRERMLELVMNVVGEERRSTIEAHRAARDAEVDRLQRRMNKLKRSLEESEHRLAHVANLKDVETGISSIYRDVQGLNAGDEKFSRKKELMADIFAANLALQKGKDAS